MFAKKQASAANRGSSVDANTMEAGRGLDVVAAAAAQVIVKARDGLEAGREGEGAGERGASVEGLPWLLSFLSSSRSPIAPAVAVEAPAVAPVSVAIRRRPPDGAVQYSTINTKAPPFAGEASERGC